MVLHLLVVLGAGNQVVDVRPDERRETVKNPHGSPLRGGGPSRTRAYLAVPPLGEHALREIYTLGELRELALKRADLLLQRGHAPVVAQPLARRLHPLAAEPLPMAAAVDPDANCVGNGRPPPPPP